MLNGQNEEPFSPNSVLGSVEIPNLQAGRVTKVNVYVITDENKGQCNKQSIKDLCSSLNERQIRCFCCEVTKSQLKKCIAENPPCGACWAGLRDSKSNDTIRQDTT
ncbi:ADP-ribosyl cyclase/cyclic ADP-ribose hydrolase 1-like isoform X2 [Labrus bergylta]